MFVVSPCLGVKVVPVHSSVICGKPDIIFAILIYIGYSHHSSQDCFSPEVIVFFVIIAHAPIGAYYDVSTFSP